jgi:3-oxoacyl-(acyl-carrier-protein) synthase
VVGTSKGDVEGIIGGQPHEGEDQIRSGPSVPSSFRAFVPPLCSLKTGGPSTTLSAACASGLHALIHAALLLRGGQARRVLVVAAEASVHPLFLGSFSRLGVLAPPQVGCRPFDQERRGFLMSEAAAAVCLESPQDAGGRAIAALEGFALGADAHHLTRGDPRGLVLRRLIGQVLNGRPADLVHAHGTGTIYNDAAELNAIEAAAGGVERESPILFSHKGALGHSLGASGLVSVVLNCLSHRQGLVPPNVRTINPMVTRLVLSRDAVKRPIRRSLALAAGFGGPVAAVGLVSPGTQLRSEASR